MSRTRVDRMAAERELMQSAKKNGGYPASTHRHSAPPKTRPNAAQSRGRKTKNSRKASGNKKSSSQHAARAPKSSLDRGIVICANVIHEVVHTHPIVDRGDIREIGFLE